MAITIVDPRYAYQGWADLGQALNEGSKGFLDRLVAREEQLRKDREEARIVAELARQEQARGYLQEVLKATRGMPPAEAGISTFTPLPDLSQAGESEQVNRYLQAEAGKELALADEYGRNANVTGETSDDMWRMLNQQPSPTVGQTVGQIQKNWMYPALNEQQAAVQESLDPFTMTRAGAQLKPPDQSGYLHYAEQMQGEGAPMAPVTKFLPDQYQRAAKEAGFSPFAETQAWGNYLKYAKPEEAVASQGFLQALEEQGIHKRKAEADTKVAEAAGKYADRLQKAGTTKAEVEADQAEQMGLLTMADKRSEIAYRRAQRDLTLWTIENQRDLAPLQKTALQAQTENTVENTAHLKKQTEAVEQKLKEQRLDAELWVAVNKGGGFVNFLPPRLKVLGAPESQDLPEGTVAMKVADFVSLTDATAKMRAAENQAEKNNGIEDLQKITERAWKQIEGVYKQFMPQSAIDLAVKSPDGSIILSEAALNKALARLQDISDGKPMEKRVDPVTKQEVGGGEPTMDLRRAAQLAIGTMRANFALIEAANKAYPVQYPHAGPGVWPVGPPMPTGKTAATPEEQAQAQIGTTTNTGRVAR